MTSALFSGPTRRSVVYLVDDEPVVREALAWLLRTRRLLAEPYSGGEAFEAMLDADADVAAGRWPAQPACLLLDIRMPGMSGPTLFERLAERGLTECLPVIFLTGHGDVPTAVAALKRGASDFVEKPFSDNGLVERVERALAASEAALARRDERLDLARRLAELTERERDVMRLIAEGRPNKLVADALNLSVRTVEVHRSRVFEKTGVKSAVELTNLLHRLPP